MLPELLLCCIIWGGQQDFGVPAELAVGQPRLCSRRRRQAAPAPAPLTFSGVAGKAAHDTTLGACLAKQQQKLLGCRPYRALSWPAGQPWAPLVWMNKAAVQVPLVAEASSGRRCLYCPKRSRDRLALVLGKRCPHRLPP